MVSLKKVGGIIVMLFLISVFFCPPSLANVPTEAFSRYPDRMMQRGEVVNYIVNEFDLKNNYSNFIGNCLGNRESCFFVFVAMSDFDEISLNPLQLYPDVYPNYRYYNAINLASMLGLVHGYTFEKDTPFKPEVVMTRVQALKVVLGAGDLIKWKELLNLVPPS